MTALSLMISMHAAGRVRCLSLELYVCTYIRMSFIDPSFMSSTFTLCLVGHFVHVVTITMSLYIFIMYMIYFH